MNSNFMMKTALLAGKIMMESGSEAYRVEDTMQRIAMHSQELEAESYVTATGIFISINGISTTQMTQARNRTINLEKIDSTNQASRAYTDGTLSLSQLHDELVTIDQQTPEFNLFFRTISAGIASLSLMMLFGGSYLDINTAFLIGALGFYISQFVALRAEIKFINDLIAVIVISSLAIQLNHLSLVQGNDTLIIGSIMPLVPGLAITSGMRDLFEGHLVTGVIRLVEAFATALVIGVGIALMLQLLRDIP